MCLTEFWYAAYLQKPRTEEERLEESDGHDEVEEQHSYFDLMKKYQRCSISLLIVVRSSTDCKPFSHVQFDVFFMIV